MATFKELVFSLERSHFINREELKDLFRKLIQTPFYLRPYHIVVLFGSGGIGKTMMIGELKRICNGYEIASSTVSMDFCQSPLTLLFQLRTNLEPLIEHKGFKEFDILLAELKDIEKKLFQKQEKDGRVSKVFGDFLGEASAAGLSNVIGGLTLGPVGILLAAAGGMLAKHSLKSSTETLLRSNLISNEDAEFLNNLLFNLISAFSKGMDQQAGTKAMIVLMLDTYEYAEKNEPLNQWITTELLPNLTDKALVVISGRNKQEGRFWQTYSNLIFQYQLKPFNKIEVLEYLKVRDISGGNVDKIFQITAGLPLGTALWVDIAEQIKSGLLEPDDTKILTEVIKAVVTRLLEQIDDATKEIIRICAIPRQFDEQIIEFLSSGTDVTAVFEQLQKYSSIFRLRLQGLSMHEEVRKYLLGDFKIRNIRYYHELNLKMAQMFSQRIQSEVKYSRLWFEIQTETAYHLLAADSEDGVILLSEIVNDAMLLRLSLTDGIGVLTALSTVISDMPVEQSSYWTFYLDAVTAFLKRDYLSAKKLSLELIKISLPKSLYAEVLSLLSIILSYCCEYKEARKYGLKALEIYEAMKNLRGEISIYERLGWISFRSGLFKEAILFQRSGLELAEKSQNRLDLGWALNGLGGSYIEFGDVRLSEKLLKRVLLIWEEVGHKAGKFCVLLHLGIVFTNSGLIDSAIQCYEDAEKAYPIFDEESWRLGRLGQAYTLKGEFKKALKMLDESRQNNYTKNTYSTFEAEAEWFAGDCYLLQKDWNQAERHYLRAVEISQKINCYYMEARALIGLLRIQFFQHSSLTKILKFVKTVGDIAKEHEYHSILAEVYLYETLAQAINILQSLSNEGTVSENQIYQLSQQFLLALQESLLYNSYVVDKTLRKIIVFSRELNVELTNKICQELISLWQSIEFLGKPIVEVESELRKRDGLPHTQIPVLDQLTEHTKITLNLSDYV